MLEKLKFPASFNVSMSAWGTAGILNLNIPNIQFRVIGLNNGGIQKLGAIFAGRPTIIPSKKFK